MSAPDSGAVAPTVRAVAHAKLTLSLRVVGLRDDGFHDLDALVTSIDEPSDTVSVTIGGAGHTTCLLSGEHEGVPDGADNLGVAAAVLLLGRVRPGAGASIAIDKHIPVEAGLGGGSADAAAVLRALEVLLPAECAGVDLDSVAADIGSDVPVCLRGGLTRVGGRGERVSAAVEFGGDVSAADVPAFHAVVVTPPVRLATSEVYASWDRLGGPDAERSVPAPAGLRPLVDELANDLEPAALAVEPDLAVCRDRLEAVAGPAVLAGSGSSYFVPHDDASDAERAGTELRSALGPGWRVVVAAPTREGVRITGGPAAVAGASDP